MAERTLQDEIEIIDLCQPIRDYQGGLWFGRNQNFADANFVDWGAARAFAAAARAVPSLVKALEQAKAALIEIRRCSIEGAKEGYAKPEKWAEDLFVSHADVASALKTIEAALSLPRSEQT